MEALQKISDDPLKDCPECSHSALQKLVSAASFRLKGGGWYETDFKSGDKKHLAESDSAKKGDGENKKAAAEKSSSKSEKADSGKSSGSTGNDKSTASTSSKNQGGGSSD